MVESIFRCPTKQEAGPFAGTYSVCNATNVVVTGTDRKAVERNITVAIAQHNFDVHARQRCQGISRGLITAATAQ